MKMVSLFVSASISGLVLVFASAGLTKIAASVPPLLRGLGGLEIAVAVTLQVPSAQITGLAIALCLCIAFTVGAVRGSGDADCLCFGASFRARGSRSRLMRSALTLVLAACAIGGRVAEPGVDLHGTAEIVMAWLAAALVATTVVALPKLIWPIQADR